MGQLLDELKTYIEPQKAVYFPKFFKAFPGDYGEGDLFWGICIQQQHLLAKK